MDLQIINGAAGEAGLLAAVTAQNELSCKGVAYTALHEASLAGNAFAWHAETADLAAQDTALAVGNESKMKLLVIVGCYLRCDQPTQVDFHFPAYPTWTGEAVTGVNLNKASTKVADATAYADETNNTQGDIFLTGFHYMVAGQATTAVPEFYNFEDMVILGEHDVVAVDVVEDISVGFECTFTGYYIDK